MSRMSPTASGIIADVKKQMQLADEYDLPVGEYVAVMREIAAEALRRAGRAAGKKPRVAKAPAAKAPAKRRAR